MTDAAPAWRLAVHAYAHGVLVAAATLCGTLCVFHEAASEDDLAAPLQPVCAATGAASLPGTVWDLTFVAPQEGHTGCCLLALYASVGSCVQRLAVFPIGTDDTSFPLTIHSESRPPDGLTALAALPVPGAPHLVLLLCEGSLFLADTHHGVMWIDAIELLRFAAAREDADAQPLPCAWAWMPASNDNRFARLALSLDCGSLLLLRVDIRDGEVRARAAVPSSDLQQGWECLSTLTWLPDGALLAYAHGGNGFVLRLQDSATGAFDAESESDEEHLRCDSADHHTSSAAHFTFSIIDTIASTSPAVAVNTLPGDAYAPTLAYGSGRAGALRCVHGGVPSQQLLASAEHFAGVIGIWPLRHSSDAAGPHALLVLSFVTATRVLAMAPGAWDDVSDASGFNAIERTLVAGTMPSGALVQVCPAGVHAIVDGAVVCTWAPPTQDTISVAATGHGIVVLGLAHSHTLTALRLLKGAWQAVAVASLHAEPSCIHIAPPGAAVLLCASGAAADAAMRAPVAVVGTYAPGVSLLALAPGAELTPLADTRVGEADGMASVRDGAVPHALHVACSAADGDVHGCCVLVATRTGVLLRLAASTDASGMLACTHVRRMGRVPLSLVPLDDNSPSSNVLLLAERPWLLRLVPGITRVSATPCAPPAAFAAGAGAAVRFHGGPPHDCVLLLDGARLRLLALGAPASPSTPLYVVPRALATHAPSGCMLVAYQLPRAHGSGAVVHEVCAIHPHTGLPVSSSFGLRAGEAVHCLSTWQHEIGRTLVVFGTSVSAVPGTLPDAVDFGRVLIMELDLRAAPDDERPPGAEDAVGDVAVAPHLRGTAEWTFVVRTHMLCGCMPPRLTRACSTQAEARMPGAVLAIDCEHNGELLAASCGETMNCLHLLLYDDGRRAVVQRLGFTLLRHVITGAVWAPNRDHLVVCDARDGTHLISLQKLLRSSQQDAGAVCSEPTPRRAAGVALPPAGSVLGGIDRDGRFFACHRDMTQVHVATAAQFRTDGMPSDVHAPAGGAVMFYVSTLLGALVDIRSVDSAVFDLLCDAEARLAKHPLTAPLLGGDHARWRGGSPGVRRVLDGDLLQQLLRLPEASQRDVLGAPEGDEQAERRMLACLAAAECMRLPLADADCMLTRAYGWSKES